MNLAKQIIEDHIQICLQPKKRRRCEPTCQEHIFALTRFQKTSTHQLDTLVNFCPKIQRGNQPQEATHPEFNHDRLYYTSAFVLGVDKKIVEQTKQQQLAQHTRIVKQTNQKNCKVLFPKPNSKHSICSVCKISYDNLYYAHILSDYHKERIRNSIYNQYIQQLTAGFSQLHPPKDQVLSSPFQLPNHLLPKAQEDTNTTENPNDNDPLPFDKQEFTNQSLLLPCENIVLDEPVRGKRGKKSTKRSQQNEIIHPVRIKSQLGELTFHKIASFTLKNGQVIEQPIQELSLYNQKKDGQSTISYNNKVYRKNERRQKRIEKGSRSRIRGKKYPRRRLYQIQMGGTSAQASVHDAQQNQEREVQSRLTRNTDGQQFISSHFTIRPLNLMEGLANQINNQIQLQAEHFDKEMHEFEELSEELKNALTPNQWIQLGLTSAEQELVEEQEAKLCLLTPEEQSSANVQLIDATISTINLNQPCKQKQQTLALSNHSPAGLLGLNQATNSINKSIYSWEKLGIPLQQFIKIKLKQALKHEQGSNIKFSTPQIHPSLKSTQQILNATNIHSEIAIQNKSEKYTVVPHKFIEILSNSVEEDNISDQSSEGIEEKGVWKKYFDEQPIKEQQSSLKVQTLQAPKREMKFNFPNQSPWKKIIFSNSLVKNHNKPQLYSDSDIDSDQDAFVDMAIQRGWSSECNREYQSERQSDSQGSQTIRFNISDQKQSLGQKQRKKYGFSII